jgi:hypothetical protein
MALSSNDYAGFVPEMQGFYCLKNSTRNSKITPIVRRHKAIGQVIASTNVSSLVRVLSKLAIITIKIQPPSK